MSKKDDIYISKTLSWLLRHAAIKEGLPINSEGFVHVDAVLNHPSLRGKCTVDDIRRIVSSSDKQRFTLRISGEGYQIRANQGHSLSEVHSLELSPITEARAEPVVVHGTYLSNWNRIRNDGLSRMNRLHVHFATGLPGNGQIISGMRRTCQVYVYIDLEKALRDGLKFYKSSNGVVLSPGNERGFIEPKYFKRVTDRDGNDIQ